MRAQRTAQQTGDETLGSARGNARRPSPTAAVLPGGSLSAVSPAAVSALQRSVGNAAVCRMLEEQRARSGGGRPDSGDGRPSPVVQRSSVHDVLNTPGRPLDPAVRAELEPRMGADFSGVRVHDDAAARASAAEVGARAYTSGHHIVIGEGGADAHTLAHELTHVIQQRQGPVAGTDNGSGLRISDPSDRFEREAEANARRVLADHAPLQRITGKPRASSTTIQRMKDDEFDELMNDRDLDASSDDMDYDFALEDALRFAPRGAGTQEESGEEAEDKPMDAASRLKRANERRAKRGVPAKGDLIGSKPVTPFGTVSLNQGYEGDLGTVVKSRKDDYPGTQGREWEKYAHLLPRLSPAQRVALADAVGAGSLTPENMRLFEQDSEARRAAAVLYGMAHNSEELRYPGASKALRAALRQNDGNYSVEEFCANFPMAKPGGAGSFRGDPQLSSPTRATLEAMSESSEEE
ncbi:eCIS core domain-containing protein [Streptomyces misionensis]|uniref:eCIS core domain-containing protein n=1 Tax=Streptomyces misionensis TaxID=67331 RepID=UPI0033A4C1C6